MFQIFKINQHSINMINTYYIYVNLKKIMIKRKILEITTFSLPTRIIHLGFQAFHIKIVSID